MEQSQYKRLLDCAAGRIPADTVFTNCQVIHVFTGEIRRENVAIIDEYIAGIGDYEGREIIDLGGRYLCPGFIDGHIHIESSMLTPVQFAAAVLPHGTTGVVCDPHEIANVCGMRGVKYMLSHHTPLEIYAMAPSCVPATHMETSGAVFDAANIGELLDHPRVLGLAEMMNFPGTIAGLQDVNEKILKAINKGVLIDGHAPGLSGLPLQAYLAAGISSDHECTSLEEAMEKIRHGMAVFIRQGSTARNLEALMPLLSSSAARHCLLVTDDRHADDLIRQGHMDYILRQAVKLGANPITALQMVTLNPAKHFGLERVGAIAPGYKANMVALEDLNNFIVNQVFCSGQAVALQGELLHPLPRENFETLHPAIKASVEVDAERVDFSIPATEQKTIKIIKCTDGQIVTEQLNLSPKVSNNEFVADVDRDIVKIAVIERHHGTQATGLGFVKGIGLKNGAMASTVAHDSHNLIVVGTSDAAMQQAVMAIVDMQGGLAVADDAQILAKLALPVAGLMSGENAEKVCLALENLMEAIKKVGTSQNNPFMMLSFLALPVIPELKITDKGLVDVSKFQLVDL